MEGLCAAQMSAMLWLTWTVAVTVMAPAMQQLNGGLLMLPLLQSSNTTCRSNYHWQCSRSAKVCQHFCQ